MDLTKDALLMRWLREIAKHPAGFETMTSLSRGVCSTTVLQLMPILSSENSDNYLRPFKYWRREPFDGALQPEVLPQVADLLHHLHVGLRRT